MLLALEAARGGTYTDDTGRVWTPNEALEASGQPPLSDDEVAAMASRFSCHGLEQTLAQDLGR
jgi:hypothetical protein